MKIKIKELDIEQVEALPEYKRLRPKKPSRLLNAVINIASIPDYIATRFSYRKINMERLGKGEPCLYLMNHSSFIDLKIAARMLRGTRYNIVSTLDTFVGKRMLMQHIGCIPTTKFVTDINLVRDMVHITKEMKNSVLMFPEAGYSFDGTATTLPDSLGRLLKHLSVPVVMIRSYGAFSRDPLYNGLKLRRVKVTAEMEYLLSPKEINEKSAEELNKIINGQFSFDSFRWQQENGIRITEDFRAEGLSRVLYKCPHCEKEDSMQSHGTLIECAACGKAYELDELGYLRAKDGETKFSHVPDWFRWQRECVRRELTEGTYGFDLPVDIYMLVDHKALYKVGDGRLTHSREGFHLVGCDGKIDYKHRPTSSYSLNADYFWYEIGDMISIGTYKKQYYCFPRGGVNVVTKMRLATEELYKLVRTRK